MLSMWDRFPRKIQLYFICPLCFFAFVLLFFCNGIDPPRTFHKQALLDIPGGSFVTCSAQLTENAYEFCDLSTFQNRDSLPGDMDFHCFVESVSTGFTGHICVTFHLFTFPADLLRGYWFTSQAISTFRIHHWTIGLCHSSWTVQGSVNFNLPGLSIISKSNSRKNVWDYTLTLMLRHFRTVEFAVFWILDDGTKIITPG
jgi:hypothetical protein